jgi:signal transduction histidine kinase
VPTTPGQGKAASVLGKRSVGDAPTRSPNGEVGEGIGLSIVKRLCEMLDATMEMQSVKDVGTTFRILFPRRYGN